MDMSVLDVYGINSEKGIARCLGDREFYERILILFLEDDTFDRARAAFSAGDGQELFNCLHELKGVSANAELTPLAEAVSPAVEALRANPEVNAALAPMFERIEAAYIKTREAVMLAGGI